MIQTGKIVHNLRLILIQSTIFRSNLTDFDCFSRASDDVKPTTTPSATIKPGVTLNPLTGLPYTQKYRFESLLNLLTGFMTFLSF